MPSATASTYVINGQKMWTSLALEADWCWLAVRTDPSAQRHRGISVLLVDMKNTPGITVQPLHLLTDHNINQVFFEDARVPVTGLVGEEHGGWNLITNQLNHERVTLVSSGMLQRYIDAVIAWAARRRLPTEDGSSMNRGSTWRSQRPTPGARPDSLTMRLRINTPVE